MCCMRQRSGLCVLKAYDRLQLLVRASHTKDETPLPFNSAGFFYYSMNLAICNDRKIHTMGALR